MKILKYKKLSSGKYKVTFDSNELILYEDVILNNNLLIEKNITLETLDKIIEENTFYEVYNKALKQLEYKMRTEKELKKNLSRFNYSSLVIDKVVEKLKSLGYLNEEKYIEAYINDKINLTKSGPYKIKRDLLNLELDETLIDNYLNTLPKNTWQKKLEKVIEKKLNTMKNLSLSTIKNKLNMELFNLGYDKEDIEYYLSKINKDDSSSLKLEYEKALNKYSKKYNGTILNMKIKDYLYRKGFDISEINNLL